MHIIETNGNQLVSFSITLWPLSRCPTNLNNVKINKKNTQQNHHFAINYILDLISTQTTTLLTMNFKYKII